MSQVKIGHYPALKVASVASATIALLATGTLAPAFAADDANQQVVSATAAVVANSTVNLADGVLIETAENPTIAADGTPTGLATVESAEIQNLETILESAKTELTVGAKDTVEIAENSVGAAIKAYPNARVLGVWTVSDPSILTVTPQGAIEAKAPGTATVTFTPAEVSQGVVTEGARSVTLEITVVAAEEPTPAVTETPAPVETAAPAPVATETPAPVATETAAPVVAETPAPVKVEAPASTPAAESAPTEAVVTSAVAADASAPVQAPASTEAVATSAVAAEAPASQAAAPRAAAASTSVYENCADVHAKLGREIHRNEVGYEPKLDRDGDGVGCELTPDYENTQNGSEQTVVNQGGSENTSSANGIYTSDGSRSVDSLASSDPANAYYGSTETTLANTGFSAMGIFAGGMTLLGLGTAAVVTSRRKAA